jgi:threonyl-tRNA synthetase
MITITFPDGKTKSFPEGITSLEIASSISEGLARNVLAAKVNGSVWDLSRKIDTDAKVSLLTWEDDLGKSAFWHSSAHLMAEALQEMY